MTLSGTDSYELILDGNYILHRADVLMGNEKSETFEIIGIPKSSTKTEMRYFNSSGESGVMTGQIEGNDFLIGGDGIKFVGEINDANTEVVGKWFRQSEESTWSEFIKLRLEKQNDL
ncbi:hypothetical protein GCM10009119_20610 [Algoriphagus jejuensis]|uniref:Uncharacterized protein n=1 Tax=Algoriphagus jejuensis TaxID=419934 RepID=A0ABN1N032_9BACT